MDCLGGHSGSEINKNRSNAILLLARFLHECGSELDLFLYDMKGGQKNNAIPRQADAEVLVSAEDAGRLEQMAKVFTSTLQKNTQAVMKISKFMLKYRRRVQNRYFIRRVRRKYYFS